MMESLEFEALLTRVRSCNICEATLPLGARPVLRASKEARLLIVGQAPGTKVHKTGIPWNDPSGDLLRRWMDIDRDTFYDETRIAIIPMGFCYPGKGKSGDLPPRKECATLWRNPLHEHLKNIELVLLIGQYAQHYYLGNKRKHTLAETVRAYPEYQPMYLPLPHPSPRNRLWLRNHAWFEEEIVPFLRKECKRLLET